MTRQLFVYVGMTPDGIRRMPIARHFEKSDMRFSSITSQRYSRKKTEIFKKYGNIEII